MRSNVPTPHPVAVVNVTIADVAVEVVGQNVSPFAVTVQKYLVPGARFEGVNVVSVRSEAITRAGSETVSTRTSSRNAPGTELHVRVGVVEAFVGAVSAGAVTETHANTARTRLFCESET